MSSHFNVSAAMLLILGGIAALLLAIFVVVSQGRAPSRGASASAPGSASSVPEAEVKYLPETNEPASATEPRAP